MGKHGSPRRRLTALSDGQLALLLSGLAAITVVVRLLAVAGWNSTTAEAIFQALGAADLALGVTLGFVPSALASLLPLAMGVMAYQGIRKSVRGWRLFITAYIGLCLVLIGTVANVAIGVLAIAVGSFFRNVDETSESPETASRQSRDYAFVILISAGLAPQLTSASMWLPVEHIERRTGQSIVGTVLEETDDRYSVLVEEITERSVVYVNRNQVVDRSICDTGAQGWLWQRLPELTGRAAEYPRCPDV